MSNEQGIYDALRDIDNSHAEHKRKFDEWTSANTILVGTPEYRAYVSNFTNWEKSVLEKRKDLVASLPAASADIALRDSLEKVKPMEFLMAMMTMSMKDSSFLKSVLTTHKQITTSNDMKQSVLANAQPVHGPSFNPNIPPPALRSVNGGGKGSPYGYGGRMDLTAKNDWTSEPGIKRVFRPPSPIAEYKSGNPLPFRDFSQT